MSTFTIDLQAFADRTKASLDTVIRKAVMDIARSVIYKSPVGNPDLWKYTAPPGYSGGRFRANWLLGVGSPRTETVAAEDEHGRDTLNAIASDIRRAQAGGVVYLTNNLPYARRLEYGWSGQAPQGMVRLTVLEWNRFVERAAREAFGGAS